MGRLLEEENNGHADERRNDQRCKICDSPIHLNTVSLLQIRRRLSSYKSVSIPHQREIWWTGRDLNPRPSGLTGSNSVTLANRTFFSPKPSRVLAYQAELPAQLACSRRGKARGLKTLESRGQCVMVLMIGIIASS